MSLRARNERGNLVALQGGDAQLRDCFVPRNDKVFIIYEQVRKQHPVNLTESVQSGFLLS